MATKNNRTSTFGVRRSVASSNAASTQFDTYDAENRPVQIGGGRKSSSSTLLVAAQQKEVAKRKSQIVGLVPSMCRPSKTTSGTSKVTTSFKPLTSSTSAANDRVPLGQLTNNTRVHAIPLLPKKQHVAPPQIVTTSKQGGFVIHVDENDESTAPQAKADKSTLLQEKENAGDVMANVQSRQLAPTLNLDLQDNLKESPMVLDVSTCSSDRLGLNDDKENQAPECDYEDIAGIAKADGESKAEVQSTVLVEDSVAALYAADIYAYLRRLELVYRPKAKYMLKQADITNGMRSILVDWLVEVIEEYRMQPETLFLAISYIDRFLSSMSVLRTKLQLVGTAATLVAAKFEEIYPPEIDEFVYITDDTYTKQQVLRMEQVILRVLSFGLATPTIHYFLNRYCIMGQLDNYCRNLAMYLSELSLLEADPYLQFVPSIIAASAICLACHTLDMDPWNEQLQSQSGYNIRDFSECLTCLHKTYVNASHYPQQSVREKYKGKKYSEVANIIPPVNLPI